MDNFIMLPDHGSERALATRRRAGRKRFAGSACLVVWFVLSLVMSLITTLVASSDAYAGGKRHFHRKGFSTNCLYVRTDNRWDEWGGLPGAKRRNHYGSSCLRPGYDHSIVKGAEMTINGQHITPNAVYVYTVVPNHPRGTPQVPPVGLKITGTALQWQCGAGSPRQNKPYKCPSGQRTLAWITMPACWNGGSRVVYGPCGPNQTQLPVWQLEFSWPVSDATHAKFRGGGEFYASWENHWKVKALTSLVKNCVQDPTPCGSVVNYFKDHPLG